MGPTPRQFVSLFLVAASFLGVVQPQPLRHLAGLGV